MLEKITTVLEQFDARGSFSAKETTDAEDLHIEINSIGQLRFPLKPGVVKKMIKVAKPATFGWREKTCLDSEVRNVWKIPKSRVRIDKRRWNKTLNPAVGKLKAELGLPDQSRLRADLHDVLIYAPGQFFRSHQDSEKCDGMVATLVVVLPSPHKGGGLIIDHQGEKRRYQSSRAAADKLAFFAFYADCHHEVRPVTEGYRVALIYNLILKEGAEKITPPSAAQPQQLLTEVLSSYFTASPTEDDSRESARKIVYLLDHQYTPKGLSWKVLKNIDQLRSSALSEAAATLDLEIYLALADIQEIWDCEIDEPYWGGSRRRHWDYYDDDDLEGDSDDEANAELLELIDDSTIIKYWRDAAGKAVGLPEWCAYGREVCWTKATEKFNPFESEYEGWMGNWGNTMERWYHRAAIILWRREDRYAALLEIAPEIMIRELLQLAEKKKTQQQAQEIVRRLLPNWSGSNNSRIESSSFSPILRLALKLDDPDLANGFLLPLSIDALHPKSVQAMIRLQAAYGTPWLIDVIKGWLVETPVYEAWGNLIGKLSPIIKRWVAHAPDEHGELSHWLLAHQLSVLKQKHLYQAQADAPVSHLKNSPARIAEVTDLLSASLLSFDNAIFHETIDHLITNVSGYLIFDLVEIARFVKQQSHQAGASGRECARFLEFVRGELTKVLDSPPRKTGDWSILETGRCDCADCKVLEAFLQSSCLERKVWPLAKKRRQHIHQMIDAIGVPVIHRTERTGSPHKLHLTKTKQLFQQDQAQRVRLNEALDDLVE